MRKILCEIEESCIGGKSYVRMQWCLKLEEAALGHVKNLRVPPNSKLHFPVQNFASNVFIATTQ